MESHEPTSPPSNDEIASEIREKNLGVGGYLPGYIDAEHELALMLNHRLDNTMAKQRMMYKQVRDRMRNTNKQRVKKRKAEKLSRRKNAR